MSDDTEMRPLIMLLGLGDLGAILLELLAREDGVGSIVVGSRNRERGVARCNLAGLGASAQGRVAPEIRFLHTDLRDAERVAETINRERPDVIVCAATLLSWWLPSLLPVTAAARLKAAGFGAWLPAHLALAMKLMEAVRAAAYEGHTLMAPYPDAVNPALAGMGLAPTCGFGNVDEMAAKVRVLAARRLDVVPSEVRVTLVAHHALWGAALGGSGDGASARAPYFLRIQHDGRDVTAEVAAVELLFGPYPLTAGRATHFLTAGSAVRAIRALLSDVETRLHAPGPGGLPGGYPITASRAGVRPAGMEGLTLGEAVEINERSHSFDGIERIESDGTVVFTSNAVGLMEEELGYSCRRLPPGEVAARAGELVARFREYAVGHGVELPIP